MTVQSVTALFGDTVSAAKDVQEAAIEEVIIEKGSQKEHFIKERCDKESCEKDDQLWMPDD